MESHLLQMRGLKRRLIISMAPRELSHLLQMRGLKQKRTSLVLPISSRIFYRCVD